MVLTGMLPEFYFLEISKSAKIDFRASILLATKLSVEIESEVLDHSASLGGAKRLPPEKPNDSIQLPRSVLKC